MYSKIIPRNSCLYWHPIAMKKEAEKDQKSIFGAFFRGDGSTKKHWIFKYILKFSSLAITIDKTLVKIEFRWFSYISKFYIENLYSKIAHMVHLWFRWIKNAEILNRYSLLLYKYTTAWTKALPKKKWFLLMPSGHLIETLSIKK